MNTLLKTLLIILPITTAAYSAEKHNQQGHNHKSHDHDNHKKDNTKSVYGHLDVAIFTDALTDVAEDGKYNEAYSHSHLELGKSLGKNWSINSNIKLEGGPDGDSHAHGGSLSPDGDDHGLNDHMLIVEELKLDYDSEKFSGYIGKFNPVVGFDYHNFPGMYGYQSVEGYGIKERVGLGGILKHNVGDLRTYSLNFSTFFADTGGLSDSLFFKRGTSIMVITPSTQSSFSIFDLRNWRLIIVSSSAKLDTGVYVNTRYSFDPYLSLTSLKYFKSLSLSSNKESEEASNLKSLEK